MQSQSLLYNIGIKVLETRMVIGIGIGIENQTILKIYTSLSNHNLKSHFLRRKRLNITKLKAIINRYIEKS